MSDSPSQNVEIELSLTCKPFIYHAFSVYVILKWYLSNRLWDLNCTYINQNLFYYKELFGQAIIVEDLVIVQNMHIVSNYFTDFPWSLHEYVHYMNGTDCYIYINLQSFNCHSFYNLPEAECCIIFCRQQFLKF